MKKLFLTILVLTIIGFGIFKASDRVFANQYDGQTFPHCGTLYGRFTTENWPAGQTVRVYCNGDSNRIWDASSQAGDLAPDGTYLGSGLCRGSDEILTSGGSFRLPNCSCLAGDRGCLHVEIPPALYAAPYSCEIATDIGGYCAPNGESHQSDFGIGCRAPTPTPRPNVPTNTPTPTLTPTPTPRPNSTPTPTSPPACFAPAIVPNVQVTCLLCN